MPSLTHHSSKRILGTTGRKCPLKCTYCFASQPGYKSPVALTGQETYEILRSTVGDYEIIQPSSDTELFLSTEQGFRILEALLPLKKDVSFATKLVFSHSNLRRLSDLVKRYQQGGNILTVTVSLTSINLASKLEPYAPSPTTRIKNLRDMMAEGIPCVVGIRPLLPQVQDSDIQRIVDLTKDCCFCYTSGPYYSKSINSVLLSGDEKIEQAVVPWMADDTIWYKVYSPDREKQLAAYIASSTSKGFFESNVDAMLYIRELLFSKKGEMDKQ